MRLIAQISYAVPDVLEKRFGRQRIAPARMAEGWTPAGRKPGAAKV